jgi:hypothetical protein
MFPPPFFAQRKRRQRLPVDRSTGEWNLDETSRDHLKA